MSTRIEKLTKAQEDQMPAYVEKWLNIGLATGPVDLEKAKEGVCLAYTLVGLEKPTNFYTAKSPMDAIRVIKELDPKQTDREIFNAMIYGCHEAAWLSFYEYFKDVLDIEECNKIDGLVEVAKHCGWLNVYEDVVVFQDRPEVIKFDDQKRLHCEDGPAIRYSDGFAVYSWHGTVVPDEWITKKGELTAKTALTWDNIEQRRAACEIVGWARVLRELNAKVVDVDDDPMIGTLMDVDIPDVGTEKFLKVICGTGREFALPVPPNMKTALEANAWTFGLDGDILRELEIRT